jgi:hypothetical protein
VCRNGFTKRWGRRPDASASAVNAQAADARARSLNLRDGVAAQTVHARRSNACVDIGLVIAMPSIPRTAAVTSTASQLLEVIEA